MSDIHMGAGGVTPGENANAATLAPLAPLGIADWLCLAAAPTFSLMALLTCILSGDAAMPCMGAQGSSPFAGLPLTGMPAMYLLMSAFHLAPWLRLISATRAIPGKV